MKHWRLPSRLGTWIIIGAVLAALMIAPAIAFGQTNGAKGGPASNDNTIVFSPEISAEAAAATTDYWTPERMNSAISFDIVLDKTNAKQSAQSVAGPDGPAMAVAGSAPGKADASAPQQLDLSAPVAPAAPVVSYYSYPFPFTRSPVAPTSLYTVWPWSTNGKLFFSQRTRTGALLNFVCSGTSLTTSGGNNGLVWTAGHCVNSGVNAFPANYNIPNSQWAVNVRFCPAYLNGVSPYGCWNWRIMTAWTAWTVSGNLRYDYAGIATQFTSTTGRGRLGAVVGTEGLAYNYPRANYPGGNWFAFGYPADAPFNGATQWFCATSVANQDAPNALGGPLTNGVGCDMTGGSSGGGWILQFKMNAGGYLNSVNSYKWIVPAQPLAMYGPYFDSSFGTLWNGIRAR
jgi:hypothetical protein